MAIKHEKVASIENKVRRADWNDEHKITNMLGYELVEEKDITQGVGSVTFSDLDGDVDEEYMIEGDLAIVCGGGVDTHICVQPNSDTGNNYYTQSNGAYNTTAYLQAQSNMELGMTFWAESGRIRFKGNLYTESGRFRDLDSFFSGKSQSYQFKGWNYAYWVDTTNNITSLDILANSGSFTGTIRLWKRIGVS
jgi:hypothetical protein